MELRAHQVGADATLGPYGPYRAWLPKRNVGDGEIEVPGAPTCETITDEGVHADLVTSERLTPLPRRVAPQSVCQP
jgi:hypothetical protein